MDDKKALSIVVESALSEICTQEGSELEDEAGHSDSGEEHEVCKVVKVEPLESYHEPEVKRARHQEPQDVKESGLNRTRGSTGDMSFEWTTSDAHEDPPPFTGQAGTKVDLGPNPSVIDSFRLYYPPEWFANIVTETNRYATQSGAARWKPLSMSCIYAFFSFICHMCLVHKPTIEDYFSTDPVLHTTFSKHIKLSKHKFIRILRYLHLTDNAAQVPQGQPGYDPQFKIRPVLESFREKTWAIFYPSKALAIDAAMCPFRGQSHFRVYMGDKPQRYGIRFECVCESSTGIILNCEIYDSDTSSIDATVLRLLEPYARSGHEVYMDRRYSSPRLFKILCERGFVPVGTVDAKHLPKALSKDLGRGEQVFQRSGSLLAVKWRDGPGDVCLLSCKDGAGMIQGSSSLPKPESLLSYKAGKAKSGQVPSDYPFMRKTIKWWKKAFFHLFLMGVVNAHKIHNLQISEKKKSLNEFIRQVSCDLAALASETAEPAPTPRTSDASRMFCADPFPMRIPASESCKRRTPLRSCVFCRSSSGGKTRKSSSWQCRDCKSALCIECFYSFHRPQRRNNGDQ